MYSPGDPSQTIGGMYYAPAMATSQAGSYSMLTYPVSSYCAGGGYFVSPTLPTITAFPYTEGFIGPTYSVPVTVPSIPATQSPTEGEITQMFDNITFSSPPTSPQLTNVDQQPVTSTNITKDTVSE